MASSQAAAASSGALQDITSYLNGTLANLSSALHESSKYISETLGLPPGLVYSLAALIAVTMSRYGWPFSRDRGSRYGPRLGSVPAVMDDDFSYITSQDLDDGSLGPSDGRYNHPDPSRRPRRRPRVTFSSSRTRASRTRPISLPIRSEKGSCSSRMSESELA